MFPKMPYMRPSGCMCCQGSVYTCHGVCVNDIDRILLDQSAYIRHSLAQTLEQCRIAPVTFIRDTASRHDPVAQRKYEDRNAVADCRLSESSHSRRYDITLHNVLVEAPQELEQGALSAVQPLIVRDEERSYRRLSCEGLQNAYAEMMRVTRMVSSP